MPYFKDEAEKQAAKDGLKLAILAVGTQTQLANAIGVTQQSVAEWWRRGFAPAERCRKIEAVSGISCQDLRPDVFGR